MQQLGPLFGTQLEQLSEGVRVDAAQAGAGEIRHRVAPPLVMARTLATASGGVIPLRSALHRPEISTARGDALPAQVKQVIDQGEANMNFKRCLDTREDRCKRNGDHPVSQGLPDE